MTLRTHAESGVREGSYDFWRTVFDGAVRSGRKVELDLHPKGLDWRAEEYRSVELTSHGGELQAVIPGAYTASPYALQYFFELRDGRQMAHRFPGFTSDLDNPPYFVVPASRTGTT